MFTVAGMIANSTFLIKISHYLNDQVKLCILLYVLSNASLQCVYDTTF